MLRDTQIVPHPLVLCGRPRDGWPRVLLVHQTTLCWTNATCPTTCAYNEFPDNVQFA